MELSKNLACYLLIFISLCAPAQANDDCHPLVNRKVENYVIGYGSLINEKSKRDTAPKVSDNIPVMVSGFERGWIHQVAGIIYLGVIEKKDATFNGVAFNVNDPEEIYAFDRRETDYCRVKVNEKQISPLAKERPSGDNWIYVTQNPIEPTPKAEVDLSYLYIFLSGCQEIGQKYHMKSFLDQCMTTTHSWPILIKYNLASQNTGHDKTLNYNTINHLVCNNQRVLKSLSKDSSFYQKICAQL